MFLITIITGIFSALVLVCALVVLIVNPKLSRLIFKNLGRNLRRTLLTLVAIMSLVVLVCLIWTVVSFLDLVMQEQSKDIKLIMMERWQLPSQMPMSHANFLDPDSPEFLPELKPYVHHGDFMTWSFYGGSTDAKQLTRENLVFLFAMNPDHIKSMMDDMQNLPDHFVTALKEDPRNVLLGKERLRMLNLKPGDKFKIYSMNYRGIDLEFKVVGEIPGTSWNLVGIMNKDYFLRSFDGYFTQKREHHPLENRQLNLIWLRVNDSDAAAKVGSIIENSPKFTDRPLKCERASSAFAAFLDPYRGLLMAMKWLVVPAILVSMTLVISNAIAITVRERRTEMAVLKVLGFRPLQILVLVLGEALLVGALGGLLGALGPLAIVNWAMGGIPLQIGFFPAFRIPENAIAWGFAIGAATGLLGSLLPAWSARSVKVSEVFAKVA
jgi:putative ABC transport system permease protein